MPHGCRQLDTVKIHIKSSKNQRDTSFHQLISPEPKVLQTESSMHISAASDPEA